MKSGKLKEKFTYEGRESFILDRYRELTVFLEVILKYNPLYTISGKLTSWAPE